MFEDQDQYTPEQILALPISKSLDVRMGNQFARAGFPTLQDVIAGIEHYGIVQMGSRYFFGGDGPYVRNAGKKTWARVLEVLEHLGFDWRAHLLRPYIPPGALKTPHEIKARIEEGINRLVVLLEEYKQATAEEKDTP